MYRPCRGARTIFVGKTRARPEYFSVDILHIRLKTHLSKTKYRSNAPKQRFSLVRACPSGADRKLTTTTTASTDSIRIVDILCRITRPVVWGFPNLSTPLYIPCVGWSLFPHLLACRAQQFQVLSNRSTLNTACCSSFNCQICHFRLAGSPYSLIKFDAHCTTTMPILGPYAFTVSCVPSINERRQNKEHGTCSNRTLCNGNVWVNTVRMFPSVTRMTGRNGKDK